MKILKTKIIIFIIVIIIFPYFIDIFVIGNKSIKINSSNESLFSPECKLFTVSYNTGISSKTLNSFDFSVKSIASNRTSFTSALLLKFTEKLSLTFSKLSFSKDLLDFNILKMAFLLGVQVNISEDA